MQTLKKIIVFPFMTYFFLVHVSLIVILILVYFGILGEIFFPQLYVLENFDKSSSFLDYFFKFSVQLQNVWNHWYI